MDKFFSLSVTKKKRQKRDKTEAKQKKIENKTKPELKIVRQKKLNSIKGHLITYGQLWTKISASTSLLNMEGVHCTAISRFYLFMPNVN
jgi:hypothetical protein